MPSRRSAVAVAGELGFEPDEIHEWTVRKIRILKKYAQAFAKLLSPKGFRLTYVDGFCGGGLHVRVDTRDLVLGAAAEVLAIEPPFAAYHLIDIDPAKCAAIESASSKRKNVHVHRGDANNLLPTEILPLIRYDQKERGLLFVDPYKLMLSWDVMRAAGKNQAIEGFIFFPSNDIQRNILVGRDKITPEYWAAMTRFWGDESWVDVAYGKAQDLFGDFDQRAKVDSIALSYVGRLRDVAGFTHVSAPMAMLNKNNGIVYHLVFAAHHELALKIARDVMRKESAPLKHIRFKGSAD